MPVRTNVSIEWKQNYNFSYYSFVNGGNSKYSALYMKMKTKLSVYVENSKDQPKLR